MLKGASEFILDVLVPDSEGNLQFVPSASPENSYVDEVTGRKIRICATSTYHLSVIQAVFKATTEASQILDIDDSVCNRIKKAEPKLPSFPIDENGKLMEWRKNRKESEPGHRHLSHLLCFHPFSLITPENTILFNAARKNLDWRKENGQGSGGGWSGAHAAIMYAWFGDGAKAYKGLQTVLKPLQGTLLNARRIFQIDANFGATSAVAEMLIQSHLKDEDDNFIIHLLPALPAEWQSGSVNGLCSRGGFTLDYKWQQGELVSVFIYSKKGGTCNVRFKDKTVRVSLEAGEKKKINDL
jgi:alpha-L-fucosidase 2